jgi:flagellin
MRINTNISSVNTLRQLGKSNEALGKTFGRLSSGFRINRAADDAAGLGIANKLRADIRSMQQASRNAEQANSLLQVAEGAAQTISGIVERMKELGVQAASDNVSSDSRTLINAEFTTLKAEITRIVGTAKFQGQALVDGTMGTQVDASSTADDLAEVSSITLSGTKAGTYTFAQTTTAVSLSNSGVVQTLSGLSAGAQTLSFSSFGIDVAVDSAFAVGAGSETFGTETIVVTSANSDFVVSSSGSYDDKDRVQLGAMDLSLTALTIAGTMDTKTNAVTALGQIDQAITNISTVFGTIGAAQNRLDFARANVNTAVENFQAAESVIRDADMAAEVTQMTKFQVLQQAGTAILAQANQTPQSVLSLLR